LKPLVSIIIPAYNAAATLPATINSALQQLSNEYDIEIIIVNDGSTDNTAEVLGSFKEQCAIITITNQGVSAARTTGLKHAKGGYIQYLDSDDLLIPGKIKQQLDALINSKADIAYGDWQKFTQKDEEIAITETITKQINGDPIIDIFTNFWCPPAALLYSRKIVDKISWNPNLPIIQDARYLLDAAISGGKIVYTPGVQAQYRTQQNNSLSQRDNLAFTKDCFINAKELYTLWEHDIKTDAAKKDALINVLRNCITEFSIKDKTLFNQSINLLLKISPGYIPAQPGMHQSLSRLLGFKNAEKIASFKRKLTK
jgi:glycosyltransferase involved in cell wall biosynthesis